MNSDSRSEERPISCKTECDDDDELPLMIARERWRILSSQEAAKRDDDNPINEEAIDWNVDEERRFENIEEKQPIIVSIECATLELPVTYDENESTASPMCQGSVTLTNTTGNHECNDMLVNLADVDAVEIAEEVADTECHYEVKELASGRGFDDMVTKCQVLDDVKKAKEFELIKICPTLADEPTVLTSCVTSSISSDHSIDKVGSFADIDSLKTSNESQLGNRLFPCIICSKSFPRKNHLSCHMRAHYQKRSFACSICSKSFTRRRDLSLHIQMHSGDRPFSCDACSRSFARKNHLSRHMRVHSDDRPFSCRHCSKSFTQNSTLTAHMSIHSGDRPFSCNVCSKSFKYKSDLTRHMRIHSGDRPFSCSLCSKSFTQNSSLTSHMRIHSGDRPFSCNVCSKSFNHRNDLTRHMRIHSGDRPFSCSVCSKSFTQKGTLTSHMRIHTGDYPFSCSVCSKSFQHKNDLTRHMRVHSGDFPFSCIACF